MIHNIISNIEHWLSGLGLSHQWTYGLRMLIIIAIIAIVCIVANFITKELILVIVKKIVKHSKNTWDDILLEKKVFHRFSHLVPAIIIYYASTIAFEGHLSWIHVLRSGVFIYIIFIAMLIISAFLNALNEIYLRMPSSNERPIKGFLQIVNIFNYAVGGLLILSIIIDKNPGYFLTGIGALAAVLLLVFKDTLLGLVAGIQLSANDMVKLGDWISMPSKGADGTVKEISLHTVKVENWDKTISMLPSYSLVSESFINFRGLENSKARRVKRSIFLDVNSVHFLSEKEIIQFKKIDLLKRYMDEKSEMLENMNKNADTAHEVNLHRLTNIGTFRKYIELYLKKHDQLRQDMTMIVRQLQPGETGIPIELYFFSKIYDWEPYENLQSDIFDHLLSVVPEFGLKIFQNPTGADFQKRL